MSPCIISYFQCSLFQNHAAERVNAVRKAMPATLSVMPLVVTVLFLSLSNENNIHRGKLLIQQTSPSPKLPCTPASGPPRWRNPLAFCSSSQTWTLHSKWPEQRYETCGVKGHILDPGIGSESASCQQPYLPMMLLFGDRLSSKHCKLAGWHTMAFDLSSFHANGHG